MTYNQYLTKGIIDESIKEIYKDGVRVYLVRAPAPGEMVMGFTNFSSLFIDKTITQEAAYGAS
jgi:hypothetical protein